MEKIKIVYKKLDEIKPYAKNPRLNDRAVSAVMMSIQEYGFAVPIIIDGDNTIISGHTRYAAAQAMQMETVPVIIKTDLTEEKIKAFRIADNKVAEYSKWDKEMLRVEFEALEDAEFDILLTGFKQHEIDKIMEDMKKIKDIDEVSLDQIETFVKSGDIWKLGDHKLICGDSTKKETYMELLKDEKIDLIVTDPPYGINYESTNKKIEGSQKINNDNLGEASLEEFLLKVFNLTDEHLKDGGSFYIFHADTMALPFRHAVNRAKWKMSQCLIWVKDSFTMGRQDYQWIHEPILYGWKPTGPHYFAEIFTNGTTIDEDNRDFKKMKKTELLVYVRELKAKLEKGQTIIREDKPGRSNLHPTMKPVPLCGELIKNSSILGAIVFDAFGGSGSTMMACEQLNRRCRTIEMDEKFCSGIIIRWQQATGKKAELIKNINKTNKKRK